MERGRRGAACWVQDGSRAWLGASHCQGISINGLCEEGGGGASLSGYAPKFKPVPSHPISHMFLRHHPSHTYLTVPPPPPPALPMPNMPESHVRGMPYKFVTPPFPPSCPFHAQPAKIARAGDSVELSVAGIDPTNVLQGSVMCPPDFPAPLVTRFEARVVVLDAPIPLLKGANVGVGVWEGVGACGNVWRVRRAWWCWMHRSRC